MEATLRILNELEQEGLIERYALAGAMAAMFYPIEPVSTYDLDVFIFVTPKRSALSLDPFNGLYEELKSRGYEWQDLYLIIEGIPVQFLPAEKPHIVEAVQTAVDMEYKGELETVITHVPRAEYLMLIMLDAGRQKDKDRFRLLWRADAEGPSFLDRQLLADLVSKYGWQKKYDEWIRS
ncbi:hypothetical protein KQI84_14015 [bacterium]|nr:hypothetical protein [bacterium]